mgnify:CR=1 FL=1
MISRFYKPAFRTIIIFFGYIINDKDEKMQEKYDRYLGTCTKRVLTLEVKV